MKTRQAPVASEIIEQASEWFVAMREPSASSEQREAFSAWLRTSPVHVGAYLDIARLWGDAAQVDAGFDVALEENNVIPLARTVFAHASARKKSFLYRHAIAASIFVCLAISGLLLWNTQSVPAFATTTGEQRVLTLEDGSVVRLNARSKLKVRIGSELRLIELVDGQALFEVAKDPARPFIVNAGNVAVRAVGTQFDVYRKSGGTIITVVEGKVSVSASGAAPVGTVSAGQQVTVNRIGKIESPAKPNVAAAVSWTQQELVFDGQPLSAVLEEFNRYTQVPIVLADPSLAQLRVNAVLRTTTPDSLLKFVSRFEGVEIEKSDSQIRITRAR